MTTDHSTPIQPSPDSSNRPITYGGVYAIRHIESGKMYIGSAVNFQKRWYGHRSCLRKGHHHSQHLQNAWNKYGDNAFVFEILWSVEYSDDLINIEQEFIDKFKTYNDDNGYNICPTAGSPLGRKHSAESLAKISATSRGRIKSPETRARIGAALHGHTTSLETRAKIGTAHRGRIVSPETRAKLADASRNRTHTVSHEARSKIGAATKGRIVSIETRAKIAAANRARVVSPETRAKLAVATAKANRQRAIDRRLEASMIPESQRNPAVPVVIRNQACQ